MVADGFCHVHMKHSKLKFMVLRLQSLNVYYGIRSAEPIENVLKRNEMTCEEDKTPHKRIHCFTTAHQPHMRHSSSQRIHTEYPFSTILRQVNYFICPFYGDIIHLFCLFRLANTPPPSSFTSISWSADDFVMIVVSTETTTF